MFNVNWLTGQSKGHQGLSKRHSLLSNRESSGCKLTELSHEQLQSISGGIRLRRIVADLAVNLLNGDSYRSDGL
jgi:bacteriocin-like protein